jgi:uncharacterized protein
VSKIAVRMARRLKDKGHDVDVDLVEIGSILHDIGRSKTHGTDHAAVGGKMIRKLGVAEPVARIVDRHIGAGIPEEEACALGLPEGVYVPETLEEKIVCYADKLIAGWREVDISVTVEDFAAKMGGDHPAIERLWSLHREMEALLSG